MTRTQNATPATRLAAILDSEGRRQSWLAAETGIHYSELSRIVKRGMTPTPAQATAIASTLGRTVDELWPTQVAA